MDGTDDLVRIEPGGRIEAVGPVAALRLAAREGLYRVMPAPQQMVWLRERAAGPALDDPRTCRLSGEITAPGALCDVYGFVAQAGWYGELMVFDDHGARSIYVERGDVVGATSTVPSERLGQILFRYGVLTQEQVDRCLAEAATSMRFGEAAVKLGFVEREKLFALMGRQTEEIFYGSMLLARGVFYFLDSFDDEEMATRQLFPLTSLIPEGVRRMHEGRYFQSRIPSPRHVPTRTGREAQGPLDTLGVYAAVDGVRSVADICRVVGEGEFLVCRTLFQLAHQGFVAIKPPKLDHEEVVTVFNEAIALVLRELDAMDQGDAVRSQLAEIAQRGVFPRLLVGVRPADDGTLDPALLARNIAAFPDPAEAAEQLSQWLSEYVSYALFLARPHIARARRARPDSVGSPRLSQRVGALLASLSTGDAGKPASGGVR